MNDEKIIFQNEDMAVRMSDANEDGDVAISVHRKKDGIEQTPRGYVLGSNCLIAKKIASNVAFARQIEPEENPFATTDRLRDLFGQRPGTELSSRTSYVPTGTMTKIGGYNNCEFMSVNGCRTMAAEDFDEMIVWTGKHAPEDLLALTMVDPNYVLKVNAKEKK